MDDVTTLQLPTISGAQLYSPTLVEYAKFDLLNELFDDIEREVCKELAAVAEVNIDDLNIRKIDRYTEDWPVPLSDLRRAVVTLHYEPIVRDLGENRYT